MGESSAPRGVSGGSVGMSIDRPARIQELRNAAGGDESGTATATAVEDRPADRLADAGVAPTPGGGAPSADAPAGSPGRGRGPLVVAAIVVLAIVAAGVFVATSRSGVDDTAASGPTTSAPRAVVAPEAVATEARVESMCEAAEVYSLDDMLKLRDNVVADPDGFLAAYETLAVNAPGELFPLVDQLGPLTRKVVNAVKAGELTSPTAVQAWLVAMPAAELEAWVGAQQELAPKIAATCA